jgi:hypothetical protein
MANLNSMIFMQPSRNLLGAPVQAQLGFDNVPGFLKDANMPVLVVIESFKLRLFSSLSSSTTVTVQLSADGGFMATNLFGSLGLVMTYFQKSINLISLFMSKLCVAHKHSFDLAVFRGLSYRSLPLSTIKVALVS